MYILKEFIVDDMWGEKDAKIYFNDDVNFLIGENSSGKTTIIYLLASILNPDEEKIRKFDFNHCKLVLQQKNNPNKCIELKCVNSELFRIIFTDENGLSKLVKNERGGFLFDIWGENKNDKSDKKEYISKKDLVNKLSRIINFTWLSIHRNTENYQQIDTYYQPIDQRLSEIKSGLMKYFSSQA
jgi:predicted ATP-dependent endonuclease of OLD family